MINRIKQFANKNKFTNRLVYISYLIVGYITSIICFFLHLLPMQSNRIVCCNMKGKRYGDNPKYITDEILRQGLDYDIVWLLNEDVQDEIPEKIRRVKYSYFNNLYELCTAKYWIDSNAKQVGITKRKGQIYIQTWHGSYGLKKMYGDIPDRMSLIDYKCIQYGSSIIDLMVSNSRQCSEIFRRAFWYNGEILEKGSPRNDIFFKDYEDSISKVKDYFHLNNQHIALYAPTFRTNFTLECFNMDYERVIHALETKFKGKWVLLVRLHPNNARSASTFMAYNDHIINASDYSVMQELLVASELLITDYSSCMFDFVTQAKKCFLYATDVELYKNDRDYYFELEDLPFPLATSNDEMEEKILSFDEDKYIEDVNKLHEFVALNETGNASKAVVDYIVNK